MLTLLAGIGLGWAFVAVLCLARGQRPWAPRPRPQQPLRAETTGLDRYATFNAGPLDVRPPVGTVIHLFRDHTTTGD